MKLALAEREREEYKFSEKVLILTFSFLLKLLIFQLFLLFIQANDINKSIFLKKSETGSQNRIFYLAKFLVCLLLLSLFSHFFCRFKVHILYQTFQRVKLS